MILVIGENKELKKLIKEVNFSELGIGERADLQEWIIKCPEILGLDENLLIITKEYDKFDKTNRRLDILAVDNYGKLVVIELKRDVADTFVDLQAIHYAAYCSTLTLEQVVEIRSEYNNESKDKNRQEILEFIENDFTDFDNKPRIITVANDFKEETLAAVLWLRDSRIDITCVKLEAYEINDNIIITPDIIIPLPEAKQFMMHREEKSNELISKSPLINEKIFFDNLDQFGKNFFKELFMFSDEKDLITNWGTTGFSLNVKMGNENVSLLQGYPNFRGKGQKLKSTIGRMSSKVELGDEIISNYLNETLELSDDFYEGNDGFNFNINRNLSDAEWMNFKRILSKIIDDIKKRE